MTYELAKQLRDAGFPQEEETGVMIPDPNCTLLNDIDEHCKVYAPTLEELIEACGEPLYAIQRWGNNWRAVGPRRFNKNGIQEFVTGATPSEAVARLWLALNKPLTDQGGEVIK